MAASSVDPVEPPSPQQSLLEALHLPPTDGSANAGAKAQPGPARRRFRHPLWLVPDVPDRLQLWPHLSRRLGIVLQHLAAHGRTSVVKGCRGNENRGWRRTPLGGAGGMQFYLWWAPRGNPQADGLNLPENAIAVRAIRHHDDHRPLAAGVSDDYLKFTDAPDLNGVARTPWTEDQARFARARSRIRLLSGKPGTGKTTALWRAIEAQEGERILYLTWSRDLRRQAEERFASFAAPSVHVDAFDFETFLGEICGADVPRLALTESRSRLAKLIGKLSPRQLGPWAKRRDALYGELRSFLFGRADPGTGTNGSPTPIQRLSDKEYRQLRGGMDGIGAAPAKALLRVAGLLHEGIPDVFPELDAATKAAKRLRSGLLPDGFEGYDRFVVDEVQDLTLLEASVVVELYLATAKTNPRSRAPWLMMAGDEGQTVRPTGFQWSALSNLLSKRAGRPRNYQLDENLRSPRRIARVVERTSELYRDIPRFSRPARQHQQTAGRHVEAGLFHVAVPKRAEAIELLEALDDADNTVVVSPTEQPPDWVPHSLRPVVLTPAQTKGLEYQSVCVLDPSRVLFDLDAASLQPRQNPEIARNTRRATIDSLRVAISRTTETLAFLDIEASAAHLDLSRAILEDAAPYDWQDLRDHLLDPDTTPEERVLVRTNDARVLIDSAPERAWQRACQAVRLLGDPELPNAVSDMAVRLEARTTLLSTAARLLVEGLPRGLPWAEVLGTAEQTITGEPESSALGDSDLPVSPRLETDALLGLSDWCEDKTAPPFALLRSSQELRTKLPESRFWLNEALLPAAQAIRKGLAEGAREPAWADEFVDADVEGWLGLTHFSGDTAARARTLRTTAFDTLLRPPDDYSESNRERRERQGQAERLLRAIGPDLPRLGRLREAQGRLEDAADAYQRAGLEGDVLRLWRNTANWERALPLADEKTRTDLSWLLELETVVERRPDGQNRRLREAEKARLEKLLDKIQKRPARHASTGRRR